MKTILIIEDKESIRTSIANVLKLAGYKTIQASNGKEGVTLATKLLPDLILCSLMMEELDGYSVLYMLNKKAETETIPFIYISVKGELQYIRKAMLLGADDYLIKPFEDIDLLNAVECQLKKKENLVAYYCKPLHQENNLKNNKEGLPILKKIVEDCNSQVFKKRQVVYYEGDKVKGVYLLIKGKVKTTKVSEDGREFILCIYEKDDFIGANSVYSHDTYIENAIAVENSELCFFSLSEFEELINQYPDVARKFIKGLSGEVIEMEDMLVNLAYHSVRKRIAETLLHYAKYHSENKDLIPLSRVDLAAMSGTAAETVSRTLTEFVNEGLIDKKKKGIVIINPAKLNALKN